MERRIFKSLAFCAFWCLALELMAMAPPSRPHPIILIAPARMRPIQMLFDMQQMRPGNIFTYEFNLKSGQSKLHYWAAGAWQPISEEEFTDVLRVQPATTRIVVLGGADVLPETALTKLQSTVPDVLHLPTLQPAEVFNALDRKSTRLNSSHIPISYAVF